MQTVKKNVLLLVIVALGTGCGGRQLRPDDADAGATVADGLHTDGGATTVNDARFAIHLFGQRVDTTYDYADLEKKTTALDPKDAHITITADDVAAYRIGDAPSPRIQLLLTPQASKRWGGPLAATQDTQPFIVTLDDQRLYVGVVYTIYGAAALNTPVLHVATDNGQVELKIGSHQGAWMGWGWKNGNASRIDRQEIRDLFFSRGVLAPLPNP